MVDGVVDHLHRRYPRRRKWGQPALPPVPEAFPDADQSPWRCQDDHKEDHPDNSLESGRPEPVAHARHPHARVVVDGGEHRGAYPRPLQPVEASDDGDDEDVDRLREIDAARRDLGRVPNRQDSCNRGDERSDPERKRAVERHVEAERLHSGWIVADALERKTERRSREVADAGVNEDRGQQRGVIERKGIATAIPAAVAASGSQPRLLPPAAWTRFAIVKPATA